MQSLQCWRKLQTSCKNEIWGHAATHRTDGGQVSVSCVCVAMEDDEVEESLDQMMEETKRGSMIKPTTDRKMKCRQSEWKKKSSQSSSKNSSLRCLKQKGILFVALVLMKTQPLNQDLYLSCATEQSRVGKKWRKKKTTRVTELQNQKHRKGNLEVTEKKQSQRKEKKRDDSCSQGGTCCFKIPTCCLFWICNALWKQKGTKRSSLSKERRERDRDRSKYRQINETRDRKKTLITRSEMRLERGTRLWNAHRGN